MSTNRPRPTLERPSNTSWTGDRESREIQARLAAAERANTGHGVAALHGTLEHIGGY